jgi:hypothetical protein
MAVLYVYTYIHTCIHTYVRMYVRTYIHTYIRTYVRTYIYTYIYTYIHIYIHTVHTGKLVINKANNEKYKRIYIKIAMPVAKHMAEYASKCFLEVLLSA